MPEDLSSRNYKPTLGERLFHYCAHETLEAILDSSCLWLSSIYGLNDPTELRWGRELTARLLSKGRRSGFAPDFRFATHVKFSQADEHLLPVIFSLSRNGDLLSQWRAYACDGRGVAIEFDAVALSATTPVNMKSLLYRFRQQVVLVRDTLRSFSSWWERGQAGQLAVVEILPEFAVDLLSLKHPSFFEEQEVRMIHVLAKDGDSFLDPGGHTDTVASIPGVEVCYRALGGKRHPYIAMPIDTPTVLTAVILGPKNTHELSEVRQFLDARGLHSVKVRRSHSPYR